VSGLTPTTGGGLTALSGDLKNLVDALATAGGGRDFVLATSPAGRESMKALLPSSYADCSRGGRICIRIFASGRIRRQHANNNPFGYGRAANRRARESECRCRADQKSLSAGANRNPLHHTLFMGNEGSHGQLRDRLHLVTL
jgi:hypothetical protein